MKNAYILYYNFKIFHNNNSGKTATICFFQWVKFNTDVNTIKPLFCGTSQLEGLRGQGAISQGPGRGEGGEGSRMSAEILSRTSY